MLKDRSNNGAIKLMCRNTNRNIKTLVYSRNIELGGLTFRDIGRFLKMLDHVIHNLAVHLQVELRVLCCQ